MRNLQDQRILSIDVLKMGEVSLDAEIATVTAESRVK